MAFAQTTYGATPALGLPGQIANEETCNKVSREVESVAPGIAFGQPAFRGSADHGVIIGATFGATGAAVAGSGNTGNGTMGAITVTAGAKAGVYTLEITGVAANAGSFRITDPDGVFVDDGDVAAIFSAGGLAFTLADGATDFVVGDSFAITTTYTANVSFIGIAVLSPAVPADATYPDYYPRYWTGAFMTTGQIYVTAGATVADGDPVYWNPATSRYTNTATHIRIPNCVFDTSAVDGGIVEISLKSR